jgi:hypothetical protein
VPGRQAEQAVMAPLLTVQLTQPTDRVSHSVQALSQLQLPFEAVMPLGHVKQPFASQVEQGDGQLTVVLFTR